MCQQLSNYDFYFALGQVGTSPGKQAVAPVYIVGTSLVLEVSGAVLGGKESFLCYNQLHKDIMGTI